MGALGAPERQSVIFNDRWYNMRHSYDQFFPLPYRRTVYPALFRLPLPQAHEAATLMDNTSIVLVLDLD